MHSPTALKSAPFLRIENVVKTYGTVHAVNKVSLDIPRGEIFALLGPSGCGKTTLLRMLAGFESPSAGRIVLSGQDLGDLPPYARPINMMFQSYALFPHLSVWDNIAFGLRREGMPRAEIEERVEAMLRLVQLEGFAKRKPHQLSGGQQQRVALARSLAKQPQLLLLDEPLGALDKKLREETQVELVQIIREVGVTCVIVTHDQEEAMTMASRIAVMGDGKVLQVGAPHEIYETPASRYVAEFIGSVNLLDGEVIEDANDHVLVRCADCVQRVGHGITGTLGMPVTVALRPEKIQISRRSPSGEYNRVGGVVRSMAYFGSYTIYTLLLGSGKLLKVSQANAARHPEESLKVGQPAWAHWAEDAQVVLTR